MPRYRRCPVPVIMYTHYTLLCGPGAESEILFLHFEKEVLPAALFTEPALFIRVKERVHQVIPIVLRDLERLRFYTEI